MLIDCQPAAYKSSEQWQYLGIAAENLRVPQWTGPSETRRSLINIVIVKYIYTLKREQVHVK